MNRGTASAAILALGLVAAVLLWNKPPAGREAYRIDDDAESMLLLSDQQVLIFFLGGRVQQHDLRDPGQQHAIIRATGGHVDADQNCILIASQQVLRWDPQSREATPLVQVPHAVQSAVSLPGGELLIAAESRIYRWRQGELEELEHFETPPGTQRPVPDRLELVLSKDGRRVLVYVHYLYHARSEKRDLLRVYDVETWQVIAELSDYNPNYPMRRRSQLAINDDGSRVAAGNSTDVLVWDAQSGEQLHRFASPEGGTARSVLFTPDGRTVIAGFSRRDGGPSYGSTKHDYGIYIWHLQTAERVQDLKGHRGDVLDLACIPGGESLVSLGADNTLRTWSLGAAN